MSIPNILARNQRRFHCHTAKLKPKHGNNWLGARVSGRTKVFQKVFTMSWGGGLGGHEHSAIWSHTSYFIFHDALSHNTAHAYNKGYAIKIMRNVKHLHRKHIRKLSMFASDIWLTC
jgi:hypothetical protein